jgi:uncharacterized protein with GYD domain
MSHYLLRWQLKDATAKNLVEHPQDRTSPATKLMEAFGGTLHSYYFALGEFDGVAIVEFPSNTAAVACSMTAAATKAFSRFETTPLLTAKEAEEAMQMAHKTKSGYKAPNA